MMMLGGGGMRRTGADEPKRRALRRANGSAGDAVHACAREEEARPANVTRPRAVSV